MDKAKLIRVSTVPLSLNVLLKGQLGFLNQYFDLLAVSGSGADLDLVKEREQVKVEVVEMQRKIAPIKDLLSLWYLYRLFRKEKPQIVHSITPKAGLLSMLAAKLAGVPIRMHTFTGLIFPSKQGLMQKLLILMDKILCWSATNIYPEGEGVKADLIKFGITKKPLKVLANGNVNGIDLSYFDPSLNTEKDKAAWRLKWNIPSAAFVFVFVGRLVGDKGINELIEAFNKLASPDVYLLLVGPLEQEIDPLLPSTLRAINEHRKIITTGYQDDVRPFLAMADALVFPSYREGFPNVVIQAGAMGLPSIVSNISGCNEIIEHELNGLIIAPKDAAALEMAMVRIQNNNGLYALLKQNSRKLIQIRYEQSIVWHALLEEYERLGKVKLAK